MRVTMLVRNTDGLKAKIRARTREQKQRVREVAEREGDETYAIAFSLANRDTGYMADQLRLEFTRGGFNWAVGFRSEDFIGQVNPVTQQEITAFYPVFVILGTRFYAGNDFLTAALRGRRELIRQSYARAIRG